MTTHPPLQFTYKNHRGEINLRTVRPMQVFYGTAPYHDEPGHLLEAFDHDRNAVRCFDLSRLLPAAVKDATVPGVMWDPDVIARIAEICANPDPTPTSPECMAAIKALAGFKFNRNPVNPYSFQGQTAVWVKECFGEKSAKNATERKHRFVEEALELAQAQGCSKEDALKLVDHVYGRPVGEPAQEVGGVMVTLAALCNCAGINMTQAGETELARCWKNFEKIRAKQAAKPKIGPLPGPDQVEETSP